ncbi:MAG TPA: hypothetical protein VE080_00915 [Candidatus Aquicultoraceae bacterium]|nr:hypothetical protein [Candidatus Aquicultoraceae bacterium]
MGKLGTARGSPWRKTGKAILLLLILLLPMGKTARSGEPGPAGSGSTKVDPEGKKLSLSVRIAEAKNRKAGKRYFRSLLRRRKRKTGGDSFHGMQGSIPSPNSVTAFHRLP